MLDFIQENLSSKYKMSKVVCLFCVLLDETLKIII